jgi:hypothetical protein
VVLLPLDAQHWPSERLEAVLLHEFAHVRRCDFLSQLLAEGVCAFLWFNPLAWLGARALREDAESAADDVVLRSGIRPSSYAEELFLIAAEIAKKPRQLTLPGVPTMNPTKLEARLNAVLTPAARRRGVTLVQALAAAACALLIVPVVAAFQGASPQTVDEKRALQTQSLSRIKQAAVAGLIYSNDYDDNMPYVQQTASAVGVFMPYSRDKEVFQSPKPSGRFDFNLRVGGVNHMDIVAPAETLMWTEVLPDPMESFSVAFMDGHAKVIHSGKRSEIQRAAAIQPRRRPKMKPLPRNYLVPKK